MNRYDRQIRLPFVGEQRQKELADKRVLIAGCGALGTVSAELLVRAGVGHVRLVDRDIVDRTNLQRQFLYTEDDARTAQPKAVAAKRHLDEINSEIEIEAVASELNADSVEDLLESDDPPDVIVDGLDNLETRYLLNDASVSYNIPYIYGGAVGVQGMAFAIRPGVTPCFRCLFDERFSIPVAVNCDTVGVLGPLTSLVASLQANEAIFQLMNEPPPDESCIHFVDLSKRAKPFKRLPVVRREDCPCCVERRFEYLDGLQHTRASKLCGRNSVQILPLHHRSDDPEWLRATGVRLAREGKVESNGSVVRAWIDTGTLEVILTVFPDGRTLVHGTEDPAVAKAVFQRLIDS